MPYELTERMRERGQAVLTVRLDLDTHKRVKTAAEEDSRSLNGEIEWMLRSMCDLRDSGKLERP